MQETVLIPKGFRARRGVNGLQLDRDPSARRAQRVRGILDSLHRDIRAGSRVRVRQVLRGPVDVFRLELERPELACTRVTILDGNTLEAFLEEIDEFTLRDVFQFS